MSDRTSRLLLRPKTAAVSSSVFFLLWFLIGFFAGDVVTPLPNYISWLGDFMGHWMVAWTLLSSLTLYFLEAKLGRLTAALSSKIQQQVDARFAVIVVSCTSLCILLTILNTFYVSARSQHIHWSKAAWNWWLPGMLALAYYGGVILPLLVATTTYGIALHAASTYFQQIDGYDPKIPDRMFGLEPFGNIIVWGATFLVFLTLPLPMIQWVQKQERLNSAYIMIPVLLGLLWHICIWPLWNLHRRLESEKIRRGKSLSASVNQLEERLRKCKDPDQGELLKTQLDEERRGLELAAGLKTLPIGTNKLLVPGLTVLLTLAGHALGLLKDYIQITGITKTP